MGMRFVLTFEIFLKFLCEFFFGPMDQVIYKSFTIISAWP